VQFSLDPVVRMGRPADRKACLCIAMRKEQDSALNVSAYSGSLVRRMQKNSVIGRKRARERGSPADGTVKAVAPFWRFGREPLTDKRKRRG
jgi:hypothetical protein